MIINTSHMSEHEKKIFYIQNMKPVLHRDALFSDETGNFRIPAEPEKYSTVKIRFRTAVANTDDVFICIEDKEYPMVQIGDDEIFAYFEYELALTDKQVRYYFKIVCGF